MRDELFVHASEEIEREATSFALEGPGEAFTTAARFLLRARSRYEARIEPALDPRSLEGLQLLDRLDYALLERWSAMGRGYLNSLEYPVVGGELGRDVCALVDQLPASPAPYVLIGFVFYLQDRIKVMDRVSVPLLSLMVGMVEGYLHAQRDPALRQVNAQAQEQALIDRMRCPSCERAGTLEVCSQQLDVAGGAARDRFSVRCRSCAHALQVIFDTSVRSEAAL